MIKHEWRKHEKSLYLPKTRPELIEVPEQRFIMLEGRGNPNSEAFADKIAVLYGLSYAVRMLPKQGITPPGYEEYTVYPLEGVWDSDSGDPLDKDAFKYTIMIRQPDFVTAAVFDQALEITAKKKPELDIFQAYFGLITDGLCVQMLHLGPYDNEPASFAQMDAFAAANGLQRSGKTHREIYLSDARKTAPAQMKTVLRYGAKPA